MGLLIPKFSRTVSFDVNADVEAVRRRIGAATALQGETADVKAERIPYRLMAFYVMDAPETDRPFFGVAVDNDWIITRVPDEHKTSFQPLARIILEGTETGTQVRAHLEVRPKVERLAWGTGAFAILIAILLPVLTPPNPIFDYAVPGMSLLIAAINRGMAALMYNAEVESFTESFSRSLRTREGLGRASQ